MYALACSMFFEHFNSNFISFHEFQARKALRALKGLVKIQALVRGYLVRKWAAATLHSMQALIRAQVAVRSQRARRSMSKESRFQPHPARKYVVRNWFLLFMHTNFNHCLFLFALLCNFLSCSNGLMKQEVSSIVKGYQPHLMKHPSVSMDLMRAPRLLKLTPSGPNQDLGELPLQCLKVEKTCIIKQSQFLNADILNIWNGT